MAISLTSPNSLTIDETAGLQDDDVLQATFDSGVGATIATYLAGLTHASGGDLAAPEYAKQADFLAVSGADGSITSLVLTQDSSGTPFSTSVGVDSGINDIDGNDIYLFAAAGHPEIVLGRVGTNDAAGAVAFALVLIPTTTGSDVTGADLYVVQYGALYELNPNDPDDALNLANKVFASYTSVTTLNFSDFSDVPSGQNVFAMIAPDSAGAGSGANQLLVTGIDASGILSTVNVSTTGLGSGAQSVGVLEAMRVDIVTGGDTSYTKPEAHDAANIVFDTHVETVTSATFGITQTNPTAALVDTRIFAFDATSDNDGTQYIDDLGLQTAVAISDVVVRNNLGVIVEDTANAIDDANIGVTFSSGVVDITNLLDDYTVTIFGSDNFDRFIVRNIGQGNEQFDLGNFSFATTVTNQDGTEVGTNMIFNDDSPQLGTIPGATVNYEAPSSVTKSFTGDSGSDGGLVTITSYTDVTGLTEQLSSNNTVLTYYDSSSDPVYRLTASQDEYTFDVLKTVLAAQPDPLNFGAVKAGSPQETLTIPTFSGNTDVVFDGLIFSDVSDPTAAANNPGAASTDDDLNPNDVGFGVKGDQASQMNQNEGFLFHTSDNDDMAALSFDIAGIGNVPTVHVQYWLYDDGVQEQTDDVLVQLPSGNNVAPFVVQNSDTTDTFDEAYVRFYFDTKTETSGVRVLDFAITVGTVQTPDQTLDFQLTDTDNDGDAVVSNSFSVLVDNPLV